MWLVMWLIMTSLGYIAWFCTHLHPCQAKCENIDINSYMTKSLIETLNLPELDAIIGQDEEENDPNVDMITNNIGAAEAALAMVDGRDHADSCDHIYKEVLEHAGAIMDLGWNVDHPRAARIFEVAGAFYKTALDAKNAKREAQFKAMKMALDQQKLEMAQRGGSAPVIEQDGDIIHEDRNELIRQFLEKKRDS